MKILDSLKKGGSFHYAPDLPFIEKYLNRDKYKTETKRTGNMEIESVKIRRLN
jgi:hypothetical protein